MIFQNENAPWGRGCQPYSLCANNWIGYQMGHWKKTGEDNYRKQLWSKAISEPWSTTKHIDSGTKLPHYYPISIFITQTNSCLYNLNLDFQTDQNLGDLAKIRRQGDCTKNRETPWKIGRVGMSPGGYSHIFAVQVGAAGEGMVFKAFGLVKGMVFKSFGLVKGPV